MPVSRRTLLGAALAVAAGCASEQRSRPSTPPIVSLPVGTTAGTTPQVETRFAAVGMVGDSITVGSEIELNELFTAEGISSVTINAEIGRRIEVGNGRSEPLNGHQAMTNLLADGLAPDVWVIALGTNDVGKYDEDGYRDLITSMLELTPTDRPLVWVDVFHPSQRRHSRLFDDLLREIVPQRPRSTVASWYGIAASGANDVLSADDLHPNDNGKRAFAELVTAAIAALG